MSAPRGDRPRGGCPRCKRDPDTGERIPCRDCFARDITRLEFGEARNKR